MMMIKGNLLDLAEEGKFDVIVHGCNCFHTMGSGIAKQIKDRYPAAYAADLETEYGDRRKLGTYSKAHVPKLFGFTVVNAYTQYGFNYFNSNRDVFEYDAFEIFLESLSQDFKGMRIGIPLIGMGLAHGDTIRIMSALSDFEDRFSKSSGSLTVVIL
jgi:O-acetyl-ADP-ribose deacetylase (regulator of RNase III)